MMTEMFLGALAGHLIGDWFFQSNEMAMKKASSGGWSFYHAVFVTVFVSIGMTVVNASDSWGWRHHALLVVNLATHAVIDRRFLIRWWMTHVQAWTDPQGAPPMWGMLALDQALHVSIIALTVGVLW